jgi:hypothetical protein
MTDRSYSRRITSRTKIASPAPRSRLRTKITSRTQTAPASAGKRHPATTERRREPIYRAPSGSRACS